MAYEEKEYAQSFDWRVWRGQMPFLRPYRKTIALVVVFNLLCALIDILLPLFQRYAIDHFLSRRGLRRACLASGWPTLQPSCSRLFL
jgi:ATP-binding cassette subfamily B protein